MTYACRGYVMLFYLLNRLLLKHAFCSEALEYDFSLSLPLQAFSLTYLRAEKRVPCRVSPFAGYYRCRYSQLFVPLLLQLVTHSSSKQRFHTRTVALTT